MRRFGLANGWVWARIVVIAVVVLCGTAHLGSEVLYGQEESPETGAAPESGEGAEEGVAEDYDQGGSEESGLDDGGFDDGGFDDGGFGAAGEGEGFAPQTAGEEVDLSAIEDLLREDEAVRTQTGASYDPGTRRDPFRSLVVRRNIPRTEERERPDGPAGLLIDEIVIEGVFELADGPVAQVQSAREETSYLLRPGDQLWDGDVVSIDLEKVVFKQTVKDPTALRPFREVVKRLNP